jgi:SET domain-containing protein
LSSLSFADHLLLTAAVAQVLAIRSLRELAAGEELTCNYRYDADDAPDWFVNMLDYHR